jgi:hypothetical protein
MRTMYVSVGVSGPTAHLGLPPEVLFRSRTMLPTVARWFVLGTREIVDNDPGWNALCDGLQGSSLVLENVESGVDG